MENRSSIFIRLTLTENYTQQWFILEKTFPFTTNDTTKVRPNDYATIIIARRYHKNSYFNLSTYPPPLSTIKHLIPSPVNLHSVIHSFIRNLSLSHVHTLDIRVAPGRMGILCLGTFIAQSTRQRAKLKSENVEEEKQKRKICQNGYCSKGIIQQRCRRATERQSYTIYNLIVYLHPIHLHGQFFFVRS